ncbi:MAG: hypothetical protein NC336_06460 [Clostridium sp.]|nr:hypothetical protein [Clostridium sp.]
MKIRYLLPTIIVAAATMVSCANAAADSEDDSSSAVDTVELKPGPVVSENAAEQQAAWRVGEFYRRCVLEGPDVMYAESVCSPALLQRLSRIYSETFDGTGYAFWEFRTDAQDGDGQSVVISVTPRGNGWYRVEFLDMGTLASMTVKVTDGLISDYEK